MIGHKNGWMRVPITFKFLFLRHSLPKPHPNTQTTYSPTCAPQKGSRARQGKKNVVEISINAPDNRSLLYDLSTELRGLSLAILLLGLKFFQEVFHVVPIIFSMSESDLVLVILALVDLALVGGLKALEERGRRPRSARKKKELVAHA